MSWRQFRDIYSVQRDSGSIQCVHSICQNHVNTVPYLESLMGLIYEELFDFIYFG